ncbi:hypothetical protein [Fulvivirga sp.]|uniref:hypothetical protein n=1 Tax=Fulvivirga sp. TaxID=1931237 RepID=UPI0032EB9FAC
MREIALIFHFLGLTMGLGTSFAHAFLGIIVSKMSDEEALKFRMHSLVLSKMGNIGIILLVLSGLYLISPYWDVITSLPLLIVKLVLVVVLIIFIIIINLLTKKAYKGDAKLELMKMEKFGKMTLLIGVAIVILAVYIFH